MVTCDDKVAFRWSNGNERDRMGTWCGLLGEGGKVEFVATMGGTGGDRLLLSSSNVAAGGHKPRPMLL